MSSILSTHSQPVVITRRAFHAALAWAVVAAVLAGLVLGAWMMTRLRPAAEPSIPSEPSGNTSQPSSPVDFDQRDLAALLEFRSSPGADARVSFCNLSAWESPATSPDRRTVVIRALLVRNRPKAGQIEVTPQWSFSYGAAHRDVAGGAEFQAGAPFTIGLAGRLEASFLLPPVATQVRLVLLQSDTVIGGTEISLPAGGSSPQRDLVKIDGCGA